MDGKWGKYAMAALLLGIMVGCRSTPPVVKPVDQPEVLNKPSDERRFNEPIMPKEAFNRDDPGKRWRDMMANDSAVSPARASFGGPGGGPGGPGMMR